MGVPGGFSQSSIFDVFCNNNDRTNQERMSSGRNVVGFFFFFFLPWKINLAVVSAVD